MYSLWLWPCRKKSLVESNKCHPAQLEQFCTSPGAILQASEYAGMVSMKPKVFTPSSRVVNHIIQTLLDAEQWGRSARKKMKKQGRRRRQMASKKSASVVSPILPQIETITAVEINAYALREIQPYTWQPRRATVAGHYAHYAQESRPIITPRENFAGTVKSKVHVASSLVSSAKMGPRHSVASHQSYQARHRSSEVAVAKIRHC